MILKGNNIVLRAVEPEDIELLFEWENNTDNWKISNTLSPFSRDTMQMYIEIAQKDIFENKQLRLMIDSKDSLKTIGAIDLFDFDPFNQRAGIGVLINDVSDRRKSYASDALNTLIDYAFNVLSLKQLYCNIGVNNKSSILLFEKFGFEKIGVKKQWHRTAHNTWEDELFYQLISSI